MSKDTVYICSKCGGNVTRNDELQSYTYGQWSCGKNACVSSHSHREPTHLKVRNIDESEMLISNYSSNKAEFEANLRKHGYKIKATNVIYRAEPPEHGLYEAVVERKRVKIQTNEPIGHRTSDIGAGGKEHNIRTDNAWDERNP